MNRPEGELVDGIGPELIEPKQYAPTTDEPIPDEVMWEAERAFSAALWASGASIKDRGRGLDVIARALLAERQRAAEIARSMYSGRQIGFSAGQSIANAILAQGDAP